MLLNLQEVLCIFGNVFQASKDVSSHAIGYISEIFKLTTFAYMKRVVLSFLKSIRSNTISDRVVTHKYLLNCYIVN